jgi:hypothetical protein
LAERSLIGAAVHAFSVRARLRAGAADQTDLEFARQIPAADELAESATVYAISLVWWAHRDLSSRRELLDCATALMLADVEESSSERPLSSGYLIYARRLAEPPSRRGCTRPRSTCGRSCAEWARSTG